MIGWLMPGKTIEVSLKPEVLRWARESSGSTIEDSADRIGVSASSYLRFEREESKIRLSQLRKLAKYFKRPITVFLLSDPPSEPKPPADFRILPGQHRAFERGTCLAIRKASRLQSVASEILHKLGRDARPSVLNAKIFDDPIKVARRERGASGIDITAQFAWQNERSAYRTWRAFLEAKNILIFQLPIPLEDARGFSLSEGEPFAIAVSTSDAYRPRIFTLFHEYAHLLLRRPGVCLPGKESQSKSLEAEVEKWCDQFAGEFLVPGEEFLDFIGTHFPNDLESNIGEVLRLASNALKVSEQVALWRIWDLDLISKSIFHREMSRLQRLGKNRKRGGGRFSAPGKVIGENGRLFTSLVLEARGRNLVNYSDVADYLSMKLKYLPQVQSSLTTVAA